MSPGPDTIVVIKNSLISRKLGILTGFGIASAIFVHVGYCIAGLGVIISQSIIAFQIIKILGALYILWISYQILRVKKTSYSDVHLSKDTSLKLSSFQAFREGFITNVLNPKATLFFLAVFTQVIDPQSSVLTQVLYGTAMASAVCLWFTFLAATLNVSPIRTGFMKIRYHLDKCMWFLLAILGIKILFSDTK